MADKQAETEETPNPEEKETPNPEVRRPKKKRHQKGPKDLDSDARGQDKEANGETKHPIIPILEIVIVVGVIILALFLISKLTKPDLWKADSVSPAPQPAPVAPQPAPVAPQPAPVAPQPAPVAPQPERTVPSGMTILPTESFDTVMEPQTIRRPDGAEISAGEQLRSSFRGFATQQQYPSPNGGYVTARMILVDHPGYTEPSYLGGSVEPSPLNSVRDQHFPGWGWIKIGHYWAITPRG